MTVKPEDAPWLYANLNQLFWDAEVMKGEVRRFLSNPSDENRARLEYQLKRTTAPDYQVFLPDWQAQTKIEALK